jgi:hypothetical protein
MLTKIAVNLARRMFLMGAAAKAVPMVPDMTIGAGESIANNMIGMALPGSGIQKTTRAINSVNNMGMSLAQWRMFRMNVNAGVPKEEALAKVYAATKVMPIVKAKGVVDRANTVKGGLQALDAPVKQVVDAGKGKASVLDRIKGMASKAKDITSSLVDTGKVGMRYYT